MIDTSYFGLIDMCQRGTLDIFDATRIKFGGQSSQSRINAAESDLVDELNEAYHHGLVSIFAPNGMPVAVVSLYALVELISRCDRHNLGEYGLSLIYDFCFLQDDLQKYKIKSPKNNIRVRH